MSDNYIILSVAGSGKTTRLLKHVNNLLDQGVDKNKILLISYTNSTCEDLKKRSSVDAMTFHSFALSILSPEYLIQTSIKNIVSSILEDYFYLKYKFTLEELVSFVEMYRESEETISFTNEEDRKLNEEIKRLHQHVQRIKEDKKVMSFNDLILQLQAKLGSHLIDIFEKYEHICVDEAQDLSGLQLEILKEIIFSVFMEDQRSFLVVGDAQQSIYDFIGASEELYVTFLQELEEHARACGRDLVVEKQNKTYRFGGEILSLINRGFPQHESGKTQGVFKKHHVASEDFLEEVSYLVEEALLTYRPEEILVLFPYNNSLVQKLQNRLNLGFSTKVWLNNNLIYEGLKDIYLYLLTKQSYYGAKVLQGPFCAMEEPMFFLTVGMPSAFLEKLESFENDTEKIFEFLSKKVHGTNIDLFLFKELRKHSHSSRTFAEFFLTLPESIEIFQEGLNFSTIHSAKGLESKLVIFLDFVRVRKRNFTVNYRPFFLEQKKQNISMSKCLLYVALTRAKEELVHLVIG